MWLLYFVQHQQYFCCLINVIIFERYPMIYVNIIRTGLTFNLHYILDHNTWVYIYVLIIYDVSRG